MKKTQTNKLTETKMQYHNRMIGKEVYVIQEIKDTNSFGKPIIRTKNHFGKVIAAPNEDEFDVEFNNGFKNRVSIFDVRNPYSGEEIE